MTNIYYFIAGFICSTILFILKRKNTPKDPARYGLLSSSFTASDAHQKNVSINIEAEVMEIESNGTKSKIKIISNKNRHGKMQPAISVDKSAFEDEHWKNKLADHLDNTWVKTSDIEWLTNTISERDKKIGEILK